jgi:hypothetical protein
MISGSICPNGTSSLHELFLEEGKGVKTMKKSLVALLSCFFFVISFSYAQDRGFGVGVVTGEPTGLSVKIWTGPTNALQFSLAWRNEDEFFGNRLNISGDYLWHSFDAIQSTYRFPVYYGVGGRLISGGRERDIFGVRGVVGIDFLPRTVPLDVFLQFVPMLVLTPSTGIDAEAGLGLRFFFR